MLCGMCRVWVQTSTSSVWFDALDVCCLLSAPPAQKSLSVFNTRFDGVISYLRYYGSKQGPLLRQFLRWYWKRMMLGRGLLCPRQRKASTFGGSRMNACALCFAVLV